MLGKHDPQDQSDLFRSRLDQPISPNHQLAILAGEIDWDWIEDQLKGYYSDEGRPSVPIRTMVGLLLLKQLYNQSDESVLDRWIENPYWQYFTGETWFQHKPPFDPTDFVYFRKRVGKQGMEKVLSLTVKLHDGAASETVVQIDTTVQEKNITFPTDAKLQRRIIQYLWAIADQQGLVLRQSYKFVVKRLRQEMQNGHHPRRRKNARKAGRKLKTIVGRLLRDVERKLDPGIFFYYKPWLDLYRKVLEQKRHDKNKIYSLHELEVNCIAKGKAHKKYEFGNKVAVVRNAGSGVITGMESFETNIYDGHALEPALEQSQRIREDIGGIRPTVAVVDRGCKGRKTIGTTEIMIYMTRIGLGNPKPDSVSIYRTLRAFGFPNLLIVGIPGRPPKKMSNYEKRKRRKMFRARAGIEPVIGHLKHDHRMIRNFLSGTLGDVVSALLAGAAFNLKMRLNQLKIDLKSFFQFLNQMINNFQMAFQIKELAS